MRARLSDERGIALITAILVLVVIMALGFAAVNFAEGQQRGSQQERTRESSFNLGEAALNAQVFELGNAWPTAAAPATSPCTPTAATGTCPDPNGLANGYSAGDFSSSPTCGQPLWRTWVQDDTNGPQYYDAGALAALNPQVTSDANNDGKVWVRVTTNAQCHQVTMVGLATRVLTPLSFPQNAVTANWFKTGNNGSKTIVNTQGKSAPQSGNVYMRCNGLTRAQCLAYRPGQVSPDTADISPNPSSTTTLTATQLNSMRQEAQMAGTYWPSGSCPTGAALSSTTSGALPGAPVFVEGPCSLNGAANTAASPGVLILVNGTYTLGGNQSFYGLLYLVDAQNTAYPTSIVTLGGCSHIYGMVVIDNAGGINVGQCGQDVVYDPTALSTLRVYSGATIARNSFQVLPANVPSPGP